jgi:hypothetical protein
MKKFLAVLAVLAITGISAMAFAAEVTVGGSLEVRSRDFSNLLALPSDFPVDALTATDQANNTQRDTQNRIRIDINAKTDNVKAKLELEQDFSKWGAFVDQYSNGSAVGDSHGMGFREAWVNFNIPGIPVNVNAGHQLLQLGQGYFFRSKHFGSDAWVVANVTGNNTVAFVDVKALERDTYNADDMDAYVLLDVFKISDAMTVGIDLTDVLDRKAAVTTPGASALARALPAGSPNPFKRIDLQNIGLNFTGAFGALNLKAEFDYQMGKAEGQAVATNPLGTDAKFKGNQIIIEGDIKAGSALVNFKAARGTGLKENSNDVDQYVTILDIDPHVAFLYEYKLRTAAVNVVSASPSNDQLHTGYANTTALNLGAGFDVAPSLNIGAQLWYFRATEKTAINGAVDPYTGLDATSNDVGSEIDVNLTWKLYDNLTWTWWAGYFMPGDAYRVNSPVTGLLQDADAATGIQGVLAFKF